MLRRRPRLLRLAKFEQPPARDMNPMPAPAHTNRLARASSPYLLQHAHNPVDWFPWGDEAFARARAENKPIFLSIGYSTCHWCHVMERESFEDETTARLLNEHFISIKVDREERPDVDRVYMAFVQATTGSGGWPLNVFLTPDRQPFFGGTYFPPDNRYGRPSFRQVLQHVAAVWREQQGAVIASARAIHAHLAAVSSPAAAEHWPGVETLRQAGELFKSAYDARHGGFGGAPKFPQPSVPAFLLRYAGRFQDPEAVRMVLHTCERMAAGGIHDHLGGGFARYAVDAQWLVPHFEKMLYDQAQLVHLYLDATLVASAHQRGAPPEAHAAVVRDILDYILRDLTHREGGFFSAEDADSEGHEGKFYCWTQAELSELLSPEEFRVAARYFGVSRQGNFVDHSHPQPLAGQNVLSITSPDLAPADAPLLAAAKRKMAAARARRIRPALDDKVLTSWNGLMLGALARAYAVLGEVGWRRAAENNLRFIQARLWEAAPTPETRPPAAITPRGTLYHRWRNGVRDEVQLLDDHAFLLDGVLQLYEATLAPDHLAFAVALAETMLARFYDSSGGGFWQTPAGTSDLILRLKDDHDGAEPAGNSVAALALLKLAAITGRPEFRAAAEATLRCFAPRLSQQPHAFPFLLQALDFALAEPCRVVLAGDPASPQFQELLRAAHAVYQPNKVVLGTAGPVDSVARNLDAGEKAVAQVCTSNACLPPTASAAALQALLRGAAVSGPWSRA